MKMLLEGKTILVSGAKGGLGSFVTQELLSAGATVIGVSRSIRDSDFPSLNFRAMAAEIDGPETASAVIEKAGGALDGLVHLVGAFAGGAVAEETDVATFDRMMEMNFLPALYLIRAVLPGMKAKRSGSLVAIGARTALEPRPGLSAYSVSKAALIAFMRTVAVENKQHGISANVILPGTMDTPANRTAMPDADFSQWVDPRQVAHAVVHCVGDASRQMSGALLPVYGAEL